MKNSTKRERNLLPIDSNQHHLVNLNFSQTKSIVFSIDYHLN